MHRFAVATLMTAVLGCACASTLPERPHAAPPAGPERAATYSEGAEFLQRWHDSAFGPDPVSRRTKSYPFDRERGAVVAASAFGSEPERAPGLVAFPQATDLQDHYCIYDIAELPPKRCDRGACLVENPNACWYALRRTADDFFVAGFFVAGDDDSAAQAALTRWLDEVTRQFGPVW